MTKDKEAKTKKSKAMTVTDYIVQKKAKRSGRNIVDNTKQDKAKISKVEEVIVKSPVIEEIIIEAPTINKEEVELFIPKEINDKIPNEESQVKEEIIIEETKEPQTIVNKMTFIIKGVVYKWGKPMSGVDSKLLTSSNGLVLSSCISNKDGEFNFELEKIPQVKVCVKCYYGGIMKKKDIIITSDMDLLIFNF
jgi:hypothetical protein